MIAAGQMNIAPAGTRTRRLFSNPIAVLLGLALLAVVLFLITTLYSHAYRRMQEANSRHWFERGQSELRKGNALKAADSFRNALSFRRDREYLFQLSQALVAAGEYEEARGYLLNLWDQQPGRGELNLALARLSARVGPPDTAVRYYQNAIYGVWDSEPDRHRREVRFELADFLLNHGDRSNAEADLIALTSNLPRDYPGTLRIARLFYAAGDQQRALRYFEDAARLEPSSPEALVGAGNTAFDSGDYVAAHHYLQRAARTSSADDYLQKKLTIVDNILRLDPLQRGLSAPERSRRLVSAWKQAIATISQCAQQKGLDLAENTGPQSALLLSYSELIALRPEMKRPKNLGRADLIEMTLGRISAAENASATTCNNLSPADVALQLISKMHGTAQ